MSRKRLDKWTIAEIITAVGIGTMGAYFFVEFILATISLIEVLKLQ